MTQAELSPPLEGQAGLCQCGCGEPAPISKKTHRKKGLIKGQPCRFINGHQHRMPGFRTRKIRTVQRSVVTEVHLSGFLDAPQVEDAGPTWGYYNSRYHARFLADPGVMACYDSLWVKYGPTSAIRYVRMIASPKSPVNDSWLLGKGKDGYEYN